MPENTEQTLSILAGDHGLTLHNADDALDAMGTGLSGAIFQPADLHPDFFDFANGIAGEVMQKFVNYGFRAAFIIDANHPYGPRLDELMIDHRHHPVIRFFPTIEAARKWLVDESR